MIETNELIVAVNQYQKAYSKAVKMLNSFDSLSSDELFRMKEYLKEDILEFLKISNLSLSRFEELRRHLEFLYRHLSSGRKSDCKNDINAIVFVDLPFAFKVMISQFSSDDSHFDYRIKEGVVTPLLNTGEYDSAIRKTFVILTARLRDVFKIDDQKDGDELVNLIFGKSDKVDLALDNNKKQAMRNLISGFYAVYRNKFAHNDIQPSLSEARSIVEMANTIILEIEGLRVKLV